jgi:hypothetical protein
LYFLYKFLHLKIEKYFYVFFVFSEYREIWYNTVEFDYLKINSNMNNIIRDVSL